MENLSETIELLTIARCLSIVRDESKTLDEAIDNLKSMLDGMLNGTLESAQQSANKRITKLNFQKNTLSNPRQ